MGTLVLGWSQQALDAPHNVNLYGSTLAVMIVLSYASSLPFFYNAGIQYNKAMTERDANAESADESKI